jgi:aminopeptidase N
MKLASTGQEKKVTPADNLEKHIISAPLVRDFAFCFSERFKVIIAQADDTTVYSFYLGRNGKKAAVIAADAIKIFNRLFGKYEYPVFSVVDTNFFIGGMEYPNLVMIDDWMYNTSGTEALEYVIAHEVAHQWWYSIVGNDEIREAWLDEGLTEYSTLLYFKEKYGDAVYDSMCRDQLALYEALGGDYENDPPMDMPTPEFSGNGQYQMLAYTKPSIMYHELRLEMGDQKFFEGLQTYFSNNKYCIATSSDLIAAFEQVTNLPWAGKIKKWIAGRGESMPEEKPADKAA